MSVAKNNNSKKASGNRGFFYSANPCNLVLAIKASRKA